MPERGARTVAVCSVELAFVVLNSAAAAAAAAAAAVSVAVSASLRFFNASTKG